MMVVLILIMKVTMTMSLRMMFLACRLAMAMTRYCDLVGCLAYTRSGEAHSTKIPPTLTLDHTCLAINWTNPTIRVIRIMSKTTMTSMKTWLVLALSAAPPRCVHRVGLGRIHLRGRHRCDRNHTFRPTHHEPHQSTPPRLALRLPRCRCLFHVHWVLIFLPPQSTICNAPPLR